MVWIKVFDNLPNNPKVLRLSRSLGLDKDMVVGKLVRLWTWAITYRENGLFDICESETVAEVMRYQGDAEELFQAMLDVGLLEMSDDGGSFFIHDWEDSAGGLLDSRKAAKSTERVRRYRERQRDSFSDEDACNADETLHETQCNADETLHVTPAKRNETHTKSKSKTKSIDDDAAYFAHTREERQIIDSFVDSFGRKPNKAELDCFERLCEITDGGVVSEAIRRAALNAAKTPSAYVRKVVDDWITAGVRSCTDVGHLEFLVDVASGRAVCATMSIKDATDALQKMRERPPA